MNTIFNKNEVIEQLGGLKSAADFFGVSTQAISQWSNKKPIPKLRQLQLQLAMPDKFGCGNHQTKQSKIERLKAELEAAEAEAVA